jgi:hypothetical protein
MARDRDEGRSWPRTVFDTKEWLEAWSRSTIEKVTAADSAEPGMFAVESSPFWGGYEADAEVEPIWDRPLLTIGSLYSFYGPSYLLDDREELDAVMERARERAGEWDTAGFLVANLPDGAAQAWAELHPPDASARLDVAYTRAVGAGADPVVGDVESRVRREWRRLWRRATEQGVTLVVEREPDGERVDEVVEMANASATRHSWPPVYDRRTADEVLATPAGLLIRAEWSGQTAAGIICLEHERRLYLWGGSPHPTLLRELSPYLFVFYEIFATGAERGWDVIEAGRGNDAFKRKYGFEGTDTWSLWYARGPDEAARYEPRLTRLHERLGRVMDLPPRSLTGSPIGTTA